MSNIVIDYSLKEPVFATGSTFIDIALPLTIDAKKRQYNTNIDFVAVDKAIHNIFEWLPGQRILIPTFGNLIYKYISEVVSDVTSKNIKGAITTMFDWDSRVKLKSVIVTPDPDNNQYNVDIQYYIPVLDKSIVTQFIINRVFPLQ